MGRSYRKGVDTSHIYRGDWIKVRMAHPQRIEQTIFALNRR